MFKLSVEAGTKSTETLTVTKEMSGARQQVTLLRLSHRCDVEYGEETH